MLDAVIYEDLVFKVRNACIKLYGKYQRECKYVISPEEFHGAAQDALKEKFPEPKRPGGQPGNNNAAKDDTRLTRQELIEVVDGVKAKHESKKRRGRPKKAL